MLGEGVVESPTVSLYNFDIVLFVTFSADVFCVIFNVFITCILLLTFYFYLAGLIYPNQLSYRLLVIHLLV